MKSSKLIGVCSPQTEQGNKLMFDNPFYSELMNNIEFECRKQGYHVIISGTDADESYMNLAYKRSLDGMIIIGSYSEEFYSELRGSNVPVVLIDTYFDNDVFDNVRIDDELGGYKSTKYLIENGHKKIAFASGAIVGSGVTQRRFQGYKRALEEYDIEYDERYVLAGNVSFESGREQARKVVDEKIDVTAIMCTADIVAVGVVKQLTEMGVKIPDDISVVGFDDLHIARYTSPSITTVSQNIGMKGRVAVDMIMDQINNKEKPGKTIVLPTEIVERKSVKRI
jgi:LacI family transcriptional regulator